MTLAVSHTSHGFTDPTDIGKAVRSSGTDGQFIIARANTAANAEVVGVITSIDTANQYTITTSGFVDVVAAVPTATAGTVFFLAEADDSQLTSTEPTTAGAVSKPVAVVTESNAKMILIHYRGEVITSAVVANAPNDAQYVTLAVNGSLSAERVLTAGSGISLTDAGANGAITIANTQSSGASLSGSTDNTVATVTGANALIGEANLTFDGTDLAIASGNLNVASGYGIDFSAQASPAAGMTSELLDWYEEGTFTPSWTGSSGGAPTYTGTRHGYYTRIGRSVHWQSDIGISSLNSLTAGNTVTLSGLPFSSAVTSTVTASYGDALAITAASSVHGYVTGATALLYVWDATGGATGMTYTELSNDGRLLLHGTYHV